MRSGGQRVLDKILEHLTLDFTLRHIVVSQILGYFSFLPAAEFPRLLSLSNPPHRDFSSNRSIRAAKAPLAEVIKEMAKPRVATSAREWNSVSFQNEVLVVENNVEE